jgi:transposase
MDSHKRGIQVERLEVIETGRRRRRSDGENLRIVLESLQAPRAISSTARHHGISRSLLMTWRRAFRPERTGPQAEQAGFVPAMIVAETAPTVPAAPANGRMVIIVGKDRRVIVDAGVDATALARVLQVLEHHQHAGIGGLPRLRADG